MSLKSTTRDKLIGIVCNYLRPNYTFRGKTVEGNSVSCVIDWLKMDLPLRYNNGRRALVTEEDLEEAGFRIVEGRNDRNQRCRVVILP